MVKISFLSFLLKKRTLKEIASASVKLIDNLDESYATTSSLSVVNQQ